MPLSLKELETILWQNPATCEQRGLATDTAFFAAGRRYRNLSLAPYGIAQLVNVRFSPSERCYYVQVFVVTTSSLTVAAYQKAKRYQTALRDALGLATTTAGIKATVVPRSILIGRQVEVRSDFVYALNLDPTCQVYTYGYDVGGVRFEDIGKNWQLRGSEHAPALTQLAADLLNQRHEELALEQADRTNWLTTVAQTPPDREDYAAGLVITAQGIVANQDLLSFSDEEAGDDE